MVSPMTGSNGGGESPRNIVAFGEVLWDRLPDVEVLGGAPLNFACRCVSLGDRASIVTRLGTDILGQRAWGALTDFGVDTSLVQWDTKWPTGVVDIEFNSDRVASIHIRPDVAYDYIEPSPDALAAAEKADCVCYGTVAQRSPASRKTLQSLLRRASNALKVLDINLRDNCFTRETVSGSIERADVLKLNAQEAATLSQMFGLEFSNLPQFANSVFTRWPLRCIVITLEGKGAFAAARAGDRVYSPGYCVRLEDPLGAGDAFTAGFVHQYLRGKTLSESCRFGNALGAIVAGQVGATAALCRNDIEKFFLSPPPASIDEHLREWLREER